MIRHLKNPLVPTLILLVMFIFFYKGFLSLDNHESAQNSLRQLKNLQVELHRDILRYRNGELRQYDTLNRTLDRINRKNSLQYSDDTDPEHKSLVTNIKQLKLSFSEQEKLVEDFKTHNSVVQNSLIYFSRLQDEIFGDDNSDGNTDTSPGLLGRLSTLILAYTRKPVHETAARIYPLLDVLNEKYTSKHNTLINHSLMIIERLPEIDAIIDRFNTLNIDRQIDNIDKLIALDHEHHTHRARIYNSLLFLCSLCLTGYIVFMFIMLRNSRNTLEIANTRLSSEIIERTRTQKTLYRLVEETSSISEDDYLFGILTALCNSLDTDYACLIGPPSADGREAEIFGLIENGRYSEHGAAGLSDSPYADVFRYEHIVIERNVDQQYPEWAAVHGTASECFIGITLRDNASTITGALAVAGDRALDDANLAESILALAASRLMIERRRHQATQISKHYQRGLELIDHWVLKLIASVGDTSGFFNNVCSAAAEITQADHSLIPQIDGNSGSYAYIAVTGAGTDGLLQHIRSIEGPTLCAWSIREGKGARIDDIDNDARTCNPLTRQLGVHSALITPIFLEDRVYSTITVFRKERPFDEIDEQLLNLFAQRVQLALVNMKLVADIAAEKERAEVTLHSIGDAVITTNNTGKVDYMNNIAEQLTGWTLQNAAGVRVQDVFRVLDLDTREPMHNLPEISLTEGTAISKSLLRLVEQNGDERDIKCSISPISGSSGKPAGVIIVFHDETERRRMEHVIQHQATHDSLTGLVNRDEFNHELAEHIYDAEQHNKQHTLCYLDLDRFKLVNDTSGHAAGDELLKQITVLLNTIIRSGDILGRLGGDEFGLILRGCPVENASAISDTIINAIKGHRFIWDDRVFSIGVSIGLVQINAESVDVTEVMKRADVACYTAKDMGRNRACVYENQDSELIRRHEELHWASKISHALENRRFRLYAQPIIPLDNSKGYNRHLEILVRLEDENGKIVPPGAFIPAAERYNLMAAVDRYIINETFSHIARNSNGLHFSINLSGNSLNDDNLVDAIQQGLSEYEIDPQMICFEITETAAITNLSRARILIDTLKQTGCEFALDDFGSGLSSFGYLKNLPVDYLKIDGSFVRDMNNDLIDHAMVAAINQIGHVMGIRTIAEFVENEAIVGKLRKLGVDYGQGYHISRPAPLEEIAGEDLGGNFPGDDDISRDGFASAS